MFSFIDDMLSSNSYASEALLDEIFESQVTEDTAAKFWSQADRASRYKKDSIPTKREIEFNFMGQELTDVVEDLNAEWELRFLSRLSAALNQKDTLERLPVEDLPCSYSRCLEHRLQFEEDAARSLALDMLHDGTRTMIFDDNKRILHAKRELLMSSDRSMRIVLLFLESKPEDQLAVAVQDKIFGGTAI